MKIIIAAGGTGGHLIPAQQLSDNLLKRKDIEITFVGNALSQNRNFKKEKYKYLDIPSSSFSKKNLFKSLFLLLKGFLKSLFILRKIKPGLIVGFGSYHTFPLMLAAKFFRKKYVFIYIFVL